MTEQWQELKETIIEMRDNDGTGTQQEVCKFLANLMDLLEKQISNSEKPNKWISVSQKLPDKYGIYLVTLNNHDTDFCEFYPNDRTFGMNGNVCYEVTAWMPLPQPYKAESEDKG